MRTLMIFALICLVSTLVLAQQGANTTSNTTAQEAKQDSKDTAEKTGSALGTAARKTKNALKTAGRKTKQGVSTAATETKEAVENSPETASDVKKGVKQGYSGKAKPATLVGCLNMDDNGNLLIRSAKHRDGVVISTNEDYKAHVGHKVRLTGTWVEGGKAVDADKLEHLAATCVIPAD